MSGALTPRALTTRALTPATPTPNAPQTAGLQDAALASGVLGQSEALSPAPILDAIERYRGTIVELDSGQVIGPDQFAAARGVLIAKLRQQGLHSGDRVLVALPNGPLFIATFTAILAVGGSPLVVHFKTPPAELLRYAQRFGVRFLAAEASAEPGLADIELSAARIDSSEIASLHWGALSITDEACDGLILHGVPLHPTSGSTGLPKIALRAGFAAMEEARHYAATMSIDAADWIVAVPPMSHAYGYGMCCMVPLLTGASILSTSRFSVKLLKRALAEHPATIVPAVPAMLDVMSFGGGMDLRSLRYMLVAGAMLPRRSADQFRSKTGITPCPLYGTTETGGISVATAADGNDVDGRVGPPMAGVSVDVRPPLDASELGPEIGKLWIRSSSMMNGYLDDRGQVTPVQSDGWFETGDLARMADDATIHLRGRDSEVVNVAGLKVVPCEVEEAIVQLPGVREVKVYAGEHRSGTQIVKAAIAVDDGLTAVQIRAHCEAHLVYYKRPQVINLVEALPRTPTGKIIRDQLP